MAPKTIRKAISDALEDLSQIDLEKFCTQLLDRRVSPRVRRGQVKDSSVLNVTDVLVETYTEECAFRVTVELMREINCRESAKKLESEIERLQNDPGKDVLGKGDPKGDTKGDPKGDTKGDPKGDTKGDPKGDPFFRRISTGELDTGPSVEAQQYAASQLKLQHLQLQGPEEVEAEARACVLSEGGDPSNDRLLLSRFTIQLGQYKGTTFKWLLENNIGYVVFLLSSHQKERVHNKDQSPLMANKDSLARYVAAYPEVVQKVQSEVGVDGEALVGFGIYKRVKLRNLYNSKDQKKISYVDYLRNDKEPHKTPKMTLAVQYILKRDQDRRVPSKKLIKRKQNQ